MPIRMHIFIINNNMIVLSPKYIYIVFFVHALVFLCFFLLIFYSFYDIINIMIVSKVAIYRRHWFMKSDQGGNKMDMTSSLPKKKFMVIESEDSRIYLLGKRLFDIVASIIAIILLSPVFIVTAIAVKIEDGGPAFFTQIRVGKDGRLFRMFKFRSMCRNAEDMVVDLKHKNEADGPVFKIEADPRVTKVGAFIRKYSVDELPQLINILRGDMSIVGPRPPLECEVEQYNWFEKQRLRVKPGLTCYWQCSGRSDIGFDEWVKMDLKYIKERNFRTDMLIILKTIPAVFSAKGAY